MKSCQGIDTAVELKPCNNTICVIDAKVFDLSESASSCSMEFSVIDLIWPGRHKFKNHLFLEKTQLFG